MCADFWAEKKSVRFFLGAACDKKSVVCADSVREKIGPSIRLFLGAPYDKKSVRVRWAFPVVLSAQGYLSVQYQRHATVSKIETYLTIMI